MSECFICQRTEGIIELPLGPFCVQCVKQIKAIKQSHISKIERSKSWNATWRHLAKLANCAEKEAAKTEWQRYFESAAHTANKRVEQQHRRNVAKRKRLHQVLSWADSWSKKAYDIRHRIVYTASKSEWKKRWENTARMIYSRSRGRSASQNHQRE